MEGITLNIARLKHRSDERHHTMTELPSSEFRPENLCVGIRRATQTFNELDSHRGRMTVMFRAQPDAVCILFALKAVVFCIFLDVGQWLVPVWKFDHHRVAHVAAIRASSSVSWSPAVRTRRRCRIVRRSVDVEGETDRVIHVAMWLDGRFCVEK